VVATNGLQRQELPTERVLIFEWDLELSPQSLRDRYQYIHSLRYFSVSVAQSWWFSVWFIQVAMLCAFMLHDGQGRAVTRNAGSAHLQTSPHTLILQPITSHESTVARVTNLTVRLFPRGVNIHDSNPTPKS